MPRVTLLLLAVLSVLAMQRGDRLVIRSGICEDAKCRTLKPSGLEPSRIYVFVSIPVHKDNRHLVYGVVCAGVEVARSEARLDGVESGPAFTREYREITIDGDRADCYAVALLVRADGSELTARGDRLIVFGRG